jgi:uncharacterized protein (TIGR00288 family)
MADTERSLALFIDFENLALGFQGKRDRFDIQRVLKRMVEKGKIVAKKAYADWNRFSSYTEALHEAAIELVEIPRRAQTGKNSADIRLCVDAMDLAYSKEHIDTFVVVSGDSDFSPLVSKLKELGKHVLGLGMQVSTSELLRDNCDEFIYYEDLENPTAALPELDPQIPETKRKAFALLIDSLHALRRENKEVLWSSMIKDTMKRIKPSFNETYHSYRTFSSLLEDAEKFGLIELETDKRSGTYVVPRFGEEMRAAPPPERPPRRALMRGDGRGPRRGTRERRPSRLSTRTAPATSADASAGSRPLRPHGSAPADEPAVIAETAPSPPAEVTPPAVQEPSKDAEKPAPRPPTVVVERRPPPRPHVPQESPPAEAEAPKAPPQPPPEPSPPPSKGKEQRSFGFGVFD